MAKPFMVIATENPTEQQGTSPLPEAQKDRFLIRLNIGYPEMKDEKEMCGRFQSGHPIETLKPVTTPDRIIACQFRTSLKAGSRIEIANVHAPA